MHHYVPAIPIGKCRLCSEKTLEPLLNMRNDNILKLQKLTLKPISLMI